MAFPWKIGIKNADSTGCYLGEHGQRCREYRVLLWRIGIKMHRVEAVSMEDMDKDANSTGCYLKE